MYVWWDPLCTATQLLPAVSQSYHWYRKRVGFPVHVPSDEARRCPTTAWPEMTGSSTSVGG
jgi:hypothetical protein